MAREELKINIIIKGDRAFLGVQATECDPKMTTVQGDLQAILAQVPAFVEQANREWDVSARNPKSAIPEPAPPAPVRTASPSRAATKTAAKAPEKPAQPRFF